ncbi:MAG TPA: M48 family metalloprotease [Vicinamibacterales bacterium]
MARLMLHPGTGRCPVQLLVILALILAGIPQTSTVDTTARAAFFDRVLYPPPLTASSGPATPGDKNQQKAVEAAGFYQRGLVLAQQGAWKEAESAFRDAEKRNNTALEYRFAAAFTYLKLHKPNDAYKRYESVYKLNPANARALAGMIAAREEAQHYRDAASLWMRYVKLPLPAQELAEARAMLAGARELFAQRYEIAENPTGGAENLATPAQELEWGLAYAKELASSGVALLKDKDVVNYVAQLSQRLVKNAKQFPTNYELYVLDTAGVNATTVPGFIFVYRGLLEAAPTEAALAGVLAHEIGHSVAHHGAKKITRSYKDEQQLASLRQSDSKLSKFLAKMLELGNPVGAMEFSRDAEAQADRLAVHITFDTGFDPKGLADMFQLFEQMSPSSRTSWDLMARTHPFSIDRVNAVREYAVLLPERPLVTSSPAFTAMKKRLASLPPAPDATGRLISSGTPARAPARASASAPASRPAAPERTVAYTMAPTPFNGRMPEGWTAKKSTAQVTIFSAPAGTPEREASVWIRLAPLVAHPGWTIDRFVDDIRTANAKKLTGLQWADVDAERTPDGRAIRILQGTWTGKTSAGIEAPFGGLFVFAEFPDYIAIGQYSAPRDYFDRLSGGFDIIWNSLTYGATAPEPAPPEPRPAPRAAQGGTSFSIEDPPFTGEMPEGWVARREGEGTVIIEGAPGTEPYEMTIRLVFSEKRGNSLDSLAAELRTVLAKLPGANVLLTELKQTSEGRPARAVLADYNGKDSSGRETPFRQVIAVVEYGSCFVILGYSGPSSLHDKYAPAYEMVGTTLKER